MSKQSAKEAYRERQEDIGNLLSLIGQEVRMHSEYAQKEGLLWALVGEVGDVRRRLIETLAQLAQQDESFIEEQLAELREEGRR